jgi:hypothetical protein
MTGTLHCKKGFVRKIFHRLVWCQDCKKKADAEKKSVYPPVDFKRDTK